MLKINKTWFYKLSKLKIFNDKIFIWNNISVIIFDDLNKSLNIEIWEKTNLEYYWFCAWNNNFEINFLQNYYGSTLKVKYLMFSNEEQILKSKIYSNIVSSNTKSDIYILSLAWDYWLINLDWVIEIWDWIKNVDANLIEQNIFIWDDAKIKWLPTLLVRSNDVNASHSCKVEKINEEKIFYLSSRWISLQQSIDMILESYIVSIFRCFSMIDRLFYADLIEKIRKKIQVK